MTKSRLILSTFLTAQVLLVLFLAGCGATFDYDGLRAMNGEGDDFNSVLVREYRDFALFEADEMYDWPDAAHFGAKAMRVSRGQGAEPEKVKDWRLPSDTLGELTAARVRLMAVLEKDAPGRMPQPAARTQARYDCWVEQQEENWQTDHIARCRSDFYAALTTIEEALLIAAAESPALPAALSGRAATKPPAPETFAIFFQFDSTRVQPGDGGTLDDIAQAAKQGGTVHIMLSGHADRAGPGHYNMSLSRSRAETVRHALMERGVEAARIALSAHGETHPLVTTADGVREPRNRRVEITIGPASAL